MTGWRDGAGSGGFLGGQLGFLLLLFLYILFLFLLIRFVFVFLAAFFSHISSPMIVDSLAVWMEAARRCLVLTHYSRTCPALGVYQHFSY